jgi:osmotically-inducible protein OsmY
VVCNIHDMHTDNDRHANEAKLRDRIHDQLKRHGRVDATKIGIVVRKDQVLLWGSVATESERNTAGEIAASVAGRLNVINHIHVFQTPG